MSTDIGAAAIGRDGHQDGVGETRHLAPNGRVTIVSSNGHGEKSLLLPNGAKIEPSRLLAYLPAIYSADEFVGRFLRIFQDTLDPLDQMIENLPYFFHPAIAPPELVDWMAHWVGMEEVLDWPVEWRRNLVMKAVLIYGARGTVAGVKLHLSTILGTEPLVTENTDGFRLGGDASLGYNTSLGEERLSWFSIMILKKESTDIDQELLREIVEREKPVGTAYVLRVVEF